MDSPVTDPAATDSLRELARQLAQTQRFTLGVPRQFTIADDGSRVLFLRSRDGRDRASCLWALDEGGERLLADPSALGGGGALPEDERIRRERVRERSTGIGAYSADRSATTSVFSLDGRLWTVSIDGGVRWLPSAGPAVDPRIDPGASRVSYVTDGALHVIELSGGTDRPLASPEAPDVTYGLPEHVAAEEMGRLRGHWWSPDGTKLLVARVDNGSVERWWLTDPSDPGAEPRQMRYPVAGTANAEVSLFVYDLDGTRREVLWDHEAFEYLTTAAWDRLGPLASVQSRDQRTVRILAVDPASGETACVWEGIDKHWVDLVPGVPLRTGSGRLVVVSDVGGSRRLVIDGELVTGDGLQVREVAGAAGEAVWFVASTEPTECHVWRYTEEDGATRLTEEPGLHRLSLGGDTAVLESFTEHGHRFVISGPTLGGRRIACLEEPPAVAPRIWWLSVGPRRLRTALVLPSSHEEGARRLPVLMFPYAGPAVQRVTRARHWYFVEAQWFAEQGFAVVIADGAGTPGRGPEWEREVYGDMLTAVIADQIAALEGAAESCTDLDLGKVAIRGWSYGGLLALACVLRRPDVFHAAVAGAAPADVRMSDTYCLERFLGHPDETPENYVRCSPVLEAARLRRPLLIVHGLADDNVVVADALRTSAALLAAGKQHELLLIPTATHMVVDPQDHENLLLHELRFLHKSLGR